MFLDVFLSAGLWGWVVGGSVVRPTVDESLGRSLHPRVGFEFVVMFIFCFGMCIGVECSCLHAGVLPVPHEQ